MESAKSDNESASADRRAFLASAGKFAVGVPPALVVLLSTTMNSPALAQSGGAVGSPYKEQKGAPSSESGSQRSSEGRSKGPSPGRGGG
jgi:hypothetical protein